MVKLKIGIPRAMTYYYYGFLWKSFFEYLNMEVIISPETTRNIVAMGTNIAPDEMCLSMKIYLGHIDYLKDKCDYVLIPRIDRFDDKNQTCTNFLAVYDLVAKLFDVKILNYNIDKENDLLDGLLSIGKLLNIDKINILKAYDYALIADRKNWQHKYKEQEELLMSTGKKVLIVSHAYNIHDGFIGKSISELLCKSGLGIVFSDYFDTKITNKLSTRLSKNLYWKFSRDAIGAIELSENVDGIVFISTFPCGLDSLVNELVMRKINKPYLNIIVDDLTSEAGLETRIESFVDLLG